MLLHGWVDVDWMMIKRIHLSWIPAKELVPVVVSAVLGGPLWAGRHSCFHSDNEAVITVLEKQHAKPHLLTELLHCLFFCVIF